MSSDDNFERLTPRDFANGGWKSFLALPMWAVLAEQDVPISQGNWAHVNAAVEEAIQFEEVAFNSQEGGASEEILEIPYAEDAELVRAWIQRWKSPPPEVVCVNQRSLIDPGGNQVAGLATNWVSDVFAMLRSRSRKANP